MQKYPERMEIRLERGQLELLKQVSREQGVSLGELVREAINSKYTLRTDGIEKSKDALTKKDEEEIKKRAAKVSGRFRTSLKDLSVNHDKYLTEDY